MQRLTKMSLVLGLWAGLGSCAEQTGPAAETTPTALAAIQAPADPNPVTEASVNSAIAEVPTDANTKAVPRVAANLPFEAKSHGSFDEPWAMTFLPDGRLLVTEKGGVLKLVDLAGKTVKVGGVPKVNYGGQGGLGDVVLHPGFADNGLVYLSYIEAGRGDTRGAVIYRARLVESGTKAKLEDDSIIWRQSPKVEGQGHYGHRMAFSPDGYLFVTSGERQKFVPAQDMEANLGKVLRLDQDGQPVAGNPFAEAGGITAEIWTLGHRNLLGIAFDADGKLWTPEMGPRGGDELNLIVAGRNYGYPIVSNGDHYDGRDIPDHDTQPEFERPKLWWSQVISPAGMIFYSGDAFPTWQGSALIGGLSAKALIRVGFEGERAYEAERFEMGKRIREIEQGPDGHVWLLEDGEGGRLLELVPAN